MSKRDAKADLLEMAQDFEAKGMPAAATVLRAGAAEIDRLVAEVERLDDRLESYLSGDPEL